MEKLRPNVRTRTDWKNSDDKEKLEPRSVTPIAKNSDRSRTTSIAVTHIDQDAGDSHHRRRRHRRHRRQHRLPPLRRHHLHSCQPLNRPRRRCRRQQPNGTVCSNFDVSDRDCVCGCCAAIVNEFNGVQGGLRGRRLEAERGRLEYGRPGCSREPLDANVRVRATRGALPPRLRESPEPPQSQESSLRNNRCGVAGCVGMVAQTTRECEDDVVCVYGREKQRIPYTEEGRSERCRYSHTGMQARAMRGGLRTLHVCERATVAMLRVEPYNPPLQYTPDRG